MFLTCSHPVHPNRREFAWAAKNCRSVRYGHYEGVDGREAAVRCAALRRDEVAAYLHGATLVPVPTSGQGVDQPGDNLWSGRDIGRLLANTYGVDFVELLRRHTPVEKSSSSGARNLRRHVDSIGALAAPDVHDVVLIDDLVTTGSTICASAVAFRQANPHVRAIKGLAVAYVPAPGETAFFDFATREYTWRTLDERPRNYLVESPIARRIEDP